MSDSGTSFKSRRTFLASLAYSIFATKELDWLRMPEIKLVIPELYLETLKSSTFSSSLTTLAKRGLLESNGENFLKIAYRWSGKFEYPFDTREAADVLLVHKQASQRVKEYRKYVATCPKNKAVRIPYTTKSDLEMEEARLRRLLQGDAPPPMPEGGYGTGTVAEVLRFNFQPSAGIFQAKTAVGKLGYAIWLLRDHGSVTVDDLKVIMGKEVQSQVMNRLLEVKYVNKITSGKRTGLRYIWSGVARHPLRDQEDAKIFVFNEDPVKYYERVYGEKAVDAESTI